MGSSSPTYVALTLPRLTGQRNGKIVVELEKAAKASGIERAQLAQTIAAWEMRGLLSNVRRRHLIDAPDSAR